MEETKWWDDDPCDDITEYEHWHEWFIIKITSD